MEPMYVLFIGKVLTEVILFTVISYLYTRSYAGLAYVRFSLVAERIGNLLALKLSTKKPVTLQWTWTEIITTEIIRALLIVLVTSILIILSDSLIMFVVYVVFFGFLGGMVSWLHIRFAGGAVREILLTGMMMINFAVVWSWFIPLYGIDFVDLDVSVIWLLLISSMVIAFELIVINFSRALLWSRILEVFSTKKKAYEYPDNKKTRFRRV